MPFFLLFYVRNSRFINPLILLCTYMLLREPFTFCVNEDSLEVIKKANRSSWFTGVTITTWPSETLTSCHWYQIAFKAVGIDVPFAKTKPDLICDSASIQVSTEKPPQFDEAKRLEEIARKSSKI